MRRIKEFILIGGICLLCLNAGIIFAADKTIYEELTAPAETETQWLWGEVESIDPQKNEILVKYLDYETDQEKEVKISIDDKTTYENVTSLLEIKPQDTVSIDYIISMDGKNLAENINLEKIEVGGESEEEIPKEPTGLEGMEEQVTAPQQNPEEKLESQQETPQETAPQEKLENPEAVSNETSKTSIQEKPEVQEASTESAKLENPASVATPPEQ